MRIASTSSASFIEPIWAAKEEPERPATMIAVISTPSSLIELRPIRLIVNTSAPNWRSWTAPCWAMTIPTRKLIRPMIPKRVDPDHLEALDDRVEAEAARLADDVDERDQHRAEEAEQADQGAAGLDRGAADLGRAPAAKRRGRIGPDLDRLVGLLDLAQQGRCALVGADDLGRRGRGRCGGRARRRSCPSGRRSLRSSDEAVALEPLEPGRQHAEPRQGQIAVEMQHAAAVLDGFR